MPENLVLLVFGVAFVGLWWYIINSVRAYVRMSRLYSDLVKTKPLFIAWPLRFQKIEMGAERVSLPRPCVLTVTETGLTVYPKSRREIKKLEFSHADLRWFGRPKKYTPGFNEMWLHYESDGRWITLKVSAFHTDMAGLVRALKQVATEEQVIHYRRRRPYIHFSYNGAQPATQDIHGAWTLGEQVHLFLTPIMLVIMKEDGQIVRTLKLLDIHQIAAVPRIDTAANDGLVRFKMQGEEFAFALTKHEEFARLLALAAKRSLEDPQMVKGKKADEDEELVYEEIADESEEILEAGFYIGDDGEIHLRGA
jgi:hypothetical protein